MQSLENLVDSIREATVEVTKRAPLDEGWRKLLIEVDSDLWDIIEDIDSERRTR